MNNDTLSIWPSSPPGKNTGFIGFLNIIADPGETSGDNSGGAGGQSSGGF